MSTFVVQMELAMRMEHMLELGFDEFDLPILILGDVHEHGLTIGLPDDTQYNLRRRLAERHESRLHQSVGMYESVSFGRHKDPFLAILQQTNVESIYTFLVLHPLSAPQKKFTYTKVFDRSIYKRLIGRQLAVRAN
jgi:hypothetical protein